MLSGYLQEVINNTKKIQPTTREVGAYERFKL